MSQKATDYFLPRWVRVLISSSMLGLIIWLFWGAPWSSLPWGLGFMWLWLPVAHPCDYASYREWWANRRNWVRDGYL